MPHNNENVHPFADAAVISSYSRAEAIEDGVLVDVSETAREAGIVFPTVVSEAVWSGIVEPPANAARHGESESGRLWDVVYMLSLAIRGANKRSQDTDRVNFSVIATNSKGRKETHRLYALCGPGDTAAPVITIMMVGED